MREVLWLATEAGCEARFFSLSFFLRRHPALHPPPVASWDVKAAIFLEDSRNLWVKLKTVVEYACLANPGASQAFEGSMKKSDVKGLL